MEEEEEEVNRVVEKEVEEGVKVGRMVEGR